MAQSDTSETGPVAHLVKKCLPVMIYGPISEKMLSSQGLWPSESDSLIQYIIISNMSAWHFNVFLV